MIFKLITILASISVVDSTNIYNYYELAVQKWCSTDYMIHGLWPQINSTAYPENCKSVSYVKPSGQLLTDMNTYWHACDSTLWEHEWTKHGSCIQEQNNIDENTYFNTTISLFLENMNLLDKCENRDSLDWEINNLVRSFLKYMGIGKKQIGSVEILTIEDMDKSSVCMMLSFDDIEPLEKIF